MDINKSEQTESETLKSGVDQSKEGSAMDLQEFKNVTNQVMQDALHVWAQLWGELEDRVPSEGRELPSVGEKDMPSCEWSEFIEKMWLLRHYLDFAKRLSHQEQ